jgi:hypothetical protein
VQGRILLVSRQNSGAVGSSQIYAVVDLLRKMLLVWPDYFDQYLMTYTSKRSPAF